MLADVIPIGHVSDVNVARSNLLFSMIQDDYTINVARIISYEIQRIVEWERIRGAERLGTLGFPALITGLCSKNRVIVEPKFKIRNPIDKKFIDHHCINPKENPNQRNRAPSPPASPSSPTLEAIKKRVMRLILHFEDQQSAMCRFMMQIYHEMWDKESMDAEELSSYMNWPGDRPNSMGGVENANAEVHSTTRDAWRDVE